MLSTILDIALRSSIIYIAILLGLRLLGKRHVAQLSLVDFVLVLLISNAVQNAMVGSDSSLLGGVVAAATLLILNFVISAVLYRSTRFDVLLEGNPTLLVHNGRAIRKHLEQERITEEELERAVREHGIGSIGEVRNAVMELDGSISVVPRDGEEKQIESFKHRRTRFQRRSPA